jgi:hypothetical protein
LSSRSLRVPNTFLSAELIIQFIITGRATVPGAPCSGNSGLWETEKNGVEVSHRHRRFSMRERAKVRL